MNCVISSLCSNSIVLYWCVLAKTIWFYMLLLNKKEYYGESYTERFGCYQKLWEVL